MSIAFNHIHFVGIAGSGMSGIAEVLLHDAYKVSGSDLADNEITDRLRDLGAVIYQGHAAKNIDSCNVVVVSSAIDETNPEIIAARENHIPILRRAEMLAALMRKHDGIAIAGSHGKTTVTSMIAAILSMAGLDPTYVIGGRFQHTNSNAQLGSGNYFIAEADESDASFLHLQPRIAVITNLDQDHMQTYQHNFENMKAAFVEFLHQLPFDGFAIMNGDCKTIQELLPRIQRKILRYGFSENVDVRALNIQYLPNAKMSFDVQTEQEKFSIILNMLGRHNVENALAAITLALQLDIPVDICAQALSTFSGVKRRFEIHGKLKNKDVLIIEDYGHHPTEIMSTIETVRHTWPNKRLVMVFQPHRYTRTRDLLNDFALTLQKVDQLYLLPIYAASEAAISGVSSNLLQERIAKQNVLLSSFDSILTELQQQLCDGDILLVQGAGNVGELALQLLV